MSNFLSLNVAQFQRSDSGEFLYVFKSPFETCLDRFRNKLLYNVITNTVRPNYFLTLTIMDQAYDDICLNQSLSTTIRTFWNKMSLYCKAHNIKLAYAWRIERGSKSSKRLHVHCLLQIEGISALNFLFQVQKRWKYCDWELLMSDPYKQPFEPIEGSEMIIAYVCKYASKVFSTKKQISDNSVYVNSENIVETKRDLKPSRLVGTNRKFKMLPEYQFVFWNSDLRSWSLKMKDNWRWNKGSPERIWFWERKLIKSYKDFSGESEKHKLALTNIIFNDFEDLQFNNRFACQFIDKLEFAWQFLVTEKPLRSEFDFKGYYSDTKALVKDDFRRWKKKFNKSNYQTYQQMRNLAYSAYKRKSTFESLLYTQEMDYYLMLCETQNDKIVVSKCYQKPKNTSWKNHSISVTF